ncbi:MAG: hypothetical protein U0T81_00445 [Saprospiraceae bacterium]
MLASILQSARLDHLARDVQQLSGFGIRLTHQSQSQQNAYQALIFACGTPIQSTGDGKVGFALKTRLQDMVDLLIDHGFGYKDTLCTHAECQNPSRTNYQKRGSNWYYCIPDCPQDPTVIMKFGSAKPDQSDTLLHGWPLL